MRRLLAPTKFAVAIFAVVLLAGSVSRADSITQQNATVTLSATTNNYVTITVTNTLTNSQVLGIAQNISAIYFQVYGSTGSGASLSSSSGQITTISGGVGTLGPVSSTGWVAQNFESGLALCVICPNTIEDKNAPHMTIVGGTGSGAYSSANASINGNGPHNPFLVGSVTFTLYVPGVTAHSTFGDVLVPFGTSPVQVPEPTSLGLLLSTSAAIFGGILIRVRRPA